MRTSAYLIAGLLLHVAPGLATGQSVNPARAPIPTTATAAAYREVIEDLSEETLARVVAQRKEREAARARPMSGSSLGAQSTPQFRPASAAILNPPSQPIPELKLAPSSAMTMAMVDQEKRPQPQGSDDAALPNAPSAASSTSYSTSKNHGALRPHLVMLTNENWRPLSTAEKFSATGRDLISPFTHLSLAADAGFSWSTNDRPYLGPGWPGYWKRYGMNVADTANVDFIQGSLLPSIFHEDPRYIPMDKGRKRARIAYALSRVLITRKDSGEDGINKSKILGTFASSALSNAYYPPEYDNGLGATVTRAGISIGSDAAFNLFKEFWPDVAKKIKLNIWIQNIVRQSIRSAIRVD